MIKNIATLLLLAMIGSCESFKDKNLNQFNPLSESILSHFNFECDKREDVNLKFVVSHESISEDSLSKFDLIIKVSGEIIYSGKHTESIFIDSTCQTIVGENFQNISFYLIYKGSYASFHKKATYILKNNGIYKIKLLRNTGSYGSGYLIKDSWWKVYSDKCQIEEAQAEKFPSTYF